MSVDSDAVEGNNASTTKLRCVFAWLLKHLKIQAKKQTVDMQVNETWKVSFDDQGKIKIHHYHVMPL